jgi:hypothetical protein
LWLGGVNAIVAKERPVPAVFETAGFRFRCEHVLQSLRKTSRARATLAFVLVPAAIRDLNPPSGRHEGGNRMRSSVF